MTPISSPTSAWDRTHEQSHEIDLRAIIGHGFDDVPELEEFDLSQFLVVLGVDLDLLTVFTPGGLLHRLFQRADDLVGIDPLVSGDLIDLSLQAEPFCHSFNPLVPGFSRLRPMKSVAAELVDRLCLRHFREGDLHLVSVHFDRGDIFFEPNQDAAKAPSPRNRLPGLDLHFSPACGREVLFPRERSIESGRGHLQAIVGLDRVRDVELGAEFPGNPRTAVHGHPTVAFRRVDRDLQRPRLAAARQLRVHEFEARLIDDRFDQRSQFLRDVPIHTRLPFPTNKKSGLTAHFRRRTCSTTHLPGRADQPIARLPGPHPPSRAQLIFGQRSDGSNTTHCCSRKPA